MRDLDDYQEKYVSEPGEAFQVKYRRKHVLSIMRNYSHRHILEIGCGLEPLFSFMSDYETMTIVEPAHQFFNNARQLAVDTDKTISCIEGYFEECTNVLSELDYSFDYVVISSLLHELENPDALMEGLCSIAKDNTTIHVNVPNAYSLHRIIARGMGLINDVHELSQQQKNMQRQRVYDMDSLCEYVTSMGFDVVDKGSFIPKFLTGTQMDQMLLNNIISEDFFEGLDGLSEYIPGYGSEIYVQIKKR